MKLVRDKIPKIIESSGKQTHTRIALSDDEYSELLSKKMLEESEEFFQNPSLEEAADMYEVFRAICDLNNLSLEDVETAAHKKRSERGGFSGRVILEKVTEKTIQLGSIVTPKFSTSYLLSKENRPAQGEVGIVVSIRKFMDYEWFQYEVSFSRTKIGWYFESELDILEEEIVEATNE